MPSPFPGMDPYLETATRWPDVHHRLMTYIADDLQQHIRPKYRARIEERLYVAQSNRSVYPDITVVEHTLRETAMSELDVVPVKPTDLFIDKPLTFVLCDDEIREPFIEIVHLDSGQVVTVIEILSPANKNHGAGRELYLVKQEEVLDSKVSLVELDLLSVGPDAIALPQAKLEQLPPHRYKISVCYGPEHLKFEVYLFKLSQRLPRCRIPLKDSDPDVVLDLPAIFNQTYDNGGYADFVDYSQPPSVPLSDDERAWLVEAMDLEILSS